MCDKLYANNINNSMKPLIDSAKPLTNLCYKINLANLVFGETTVIREMYPI